jgi:hypothetical protein
MNMFCSHVLHLKKNQRIWGSYKTSQIYYSNSMGPNWSSQDHSYAHVPHGIHMDLPKDPKFVLTLILYSVTIHFNNILTSTSPRSLFTLGSPFKIMYAYIVLLRALHVWCNHRPWVDHPYHIPAMKEIMRRYAIFPFRFSLFLLHKTFGSESCFQTSPLCVFQ